ncbi:MAG: hypothetical protein HQ514_18575, partial [Rhodospirillales bacterium]|nr:hypothetical protein [Rhodospirillales bacterium]
LSNPERVRELTPEDWDFVEPRPGDVVVVNTLPGMGGGDDKSPVQTLLMVAAIALSFAAPGSQSAFAFLGESVFAAIPKLTWGTVAGFGLMQLSGLMTQNPSDRMSALAGSSGGAASSPTYRIDDAGNALNPYGQIPRALGTMRWSPPMGAKPYREVVGKELYYRLLLLPGLGPLKIDEALITVGETPLLEFEDVEVEIREGWETDGALSLFSDDVYEESFDIILRQEDGWATRTTLINVEEISVDGYFPRLTKVKGATQREARTVDLEIEYAPAGSGAWQAIPEAVSITDNSTEEVWFGRRWQVAQGQYDVRWRRITGDSSDTSIIDTCHWVTLRSVRYTDPIAVPWMAKVAIRFKANNELQGSLPPIRLTTESYLKVYDPQAGTWTYTLSANPAWAGCEVLSGAGNPRPAADSCNDLDGLVDFAAHCDANNLRVNGVIDYADSVLSLFNDIAEAGWGAYTKSGTLNSVVFDQEVAAPIQHFTPHNTIDFEIEKLWPKRPHALLCHFMNEEKAFQRDMRVVFAPGYDESNASEYEEREYHLITCPVQVGKAATREIGVSVYRDLNAKLRAKMDHLVCRPGHRVSVTRPETGWGLGSGRVKVATTSSVTLTDGVPMLAGDAYSIGFRYGTGTRKIFDLLPQVVDGEYKTVEFGTLNGAVWEAAEIPAGDVPEAGDLFQFGETDFVAKDFMVVWIDSHDGHEAMLHLAPYGDEVRDLVAGEIPAYNSRLSDMPDVDRRPVKPLVTGVDSDEEVLIALPGGGWQPRIVVSLGPRSGEAFQIARIKVRIKRSDASSWKTLAAVDAEASQISITEVQEGVAFDIELTAITIAGLSSEPAWIIGHTVVGRTTVPPDVATLFLQNGKAVWSYPDQPVDHAGYAVRTRAGTSAQWTGATDAVGGLTPAMTFDLSAVPAGTRTLMVKAMDDGGRESETAAVLRLALGDPATDNVIVTRDIGGEGFAGVLANGTLDGGELVADDHGTAYLPDGNAPYLPDGDADYLPVTYKEMTWVAA